MSCSRYLESTDVFSFEALEEVKQRLEVTYMYPPSPEMQKEFIKKHWGVRVEGYRPLTSVRRRFENDRSINK